MNDVSKGPPKTRVKMGKLNISRAGRNSSEKMAEFA